MLTSLISFFYLFFFFRGKLVYAPNTPVFAPIIQEVNQTFQDLRLVKEFSVKWIVEISPAIKRFLDRLDPDVIDNVTQTVDIDFSGLADNLTMLTNTSDVVQK